MKTKTMATIDELKTLMENNKEAILKCYPCASTCIEALIFAQKAIDIDKACEVYENELREIVRLVNALREGVGDCISIEGCVKDFRKAMEKLFKEE